MSYMKDCLGRCRMDTLLQAFSAVVIDFLSSLGSKIILEIRLCELFSFKIYAFKFINRDFFKKESKCK